MSWLITLGRGVAALSPQRHTLRVLYQAISEQQTAHPDGVTILEGDFNQANLKTVLPKLYQHVNFPTRGGKHFGSGLHSPLSHIGLSDHITVMPMPANRPRVKVTALHQHTGKCSKKQPHTTTTQTLRSTKTLLPLTCVSALIM